MITQVYIAAPFELRLEAETLRTRLNQSGIFVTSRWIDGVEGSPQYQAACDLADIHQAGAVVIINPGDFAYKGTGGRHVEVGYALAKGMPVFVLGIRTNVFHYLRPVHLVSNVNELLAAFASLEDNPSPLPLLSGRDMIALLSGSDMIAELSARVHRANAKWWHDLSTGERLDRNVGELLMLVTSELAEALEGHRKNLRDDKLTHRRMFDVELADALIRLFDIIGGMQLECAVAFDEKMDFNAVREDHSIAHRKSEHGKKY